MTHTKVGRNDIQKCQIGGLTTEISSLGFTAWRADRR